MSLWVWDFLKLFYPPSSKKIVPTILVIISPQMPNCQTNKKYASSSKFNSADVCGPSSNENIWQKKWINSVENGNFFNRVRIHIAASSLDFNAQYQNDEMNTLYFYILLHAFCENIRFMCSYHIHIYFMFDCHIAVIFAL